MSSSPPRVHLESVSVCQTNPRSNFCTRNDQFARWVDQITQSEGGFDKFSKSYERYGLNVQPNNDIVYREWAPNAQTAALTGDFSKLGSRRPRLASLARRQFARRDPTLSLGGSFPPSFIFSDPIDEPRAQTDGTDRNT